MNINRLVERSLQKGQLYRDSDKELLLDVWEAQGLYFSQTQKQAFMNCSTAETITRARRALKDKYPASETVDNQRFEKYLDHKYNRPFEYVVREED